MCIINLFLFIYYVNTYLQALWDYRSVVYPYSQTIAVLIVADSNGLLLNIWMLRV